MKRIFVCLALAIASCQETATPPSISNIDSTVSVSPESLVRALIVDTAGAVDMRVRKLDSILNYFSADSGKFVYAAALLTEPVSNPNSPFRNESLYMRLLEHQIKSQWYIDEQKMVFENRLKLIGQNRVGYAANDFVFVTPEGKKRKLYGISGERLLLLFYNPECNACKENKAALNDSRVISSALERGTLKLLAIYPDPDVALWRKHLSENPPSWINGRDENESIWKNKIYDLRAIPTMYLLDEEKKVLLKDAGVAQIEAALGGF